MWFPRSHAQWLAGLIVLLAALGTDPVDAEPKRAGGLEFSDELGGFELLSASGRGTAEDPIVLRKRLSHAQPVVLIVRLDTTALRNATASTRGHFFRAAVSVIVINDSLFPWIGFDFELQQERHQPSVYGDGLSFDQMGAFRDRRVRSSRFRHSTNAAEPFDRLRFRDGFVDPGLEVEFDVNLLDVSPVPEFYIILHPQVPVS